MLGRDCAALNGLEESSGKSRPVMANSKTANLLKNVKASEEGVYSIKEIDDQCTYGVGSYSPPDTHSIHDDHIRLKRGSGYWDHLKDTRLPQIKANKERITEGVKKREDIILRMHQFATERGQKIVPQQLITYYTNSSKELNVEVLPEIPMPTPTSQLFFAQPLAIVDSDEIIGISELVIDPERDKFDDPACNKATCYSIDRFKRNDEGGWDISHLFYTFDLYIKAFISDKTMYYRTVYKDRQYNTQSIVVREYPFDTVSREIKVRDVSPQHLYNLDGILKLNGQTKLLLTDSTQCIDVVSSESNGIDSVNCSYKLQITSKDYGFSMAGPVFDGDGVLGFAAGWLGGFGTSDDQLALKAESDGLIHSTYLTDVLASLKQSIQLAPTMISAIASSKDYSTDGNRLAIIASPVTSDKSDAQKVLPYIVSFEKWSK